MKCCAAAQANFRWWILQVLDAEELLSFVSRSLLPHSQGGGQDSGWCPSAGFEQDVYPKETIPLEVFIYTGCVYSNTLIFNVLIFLVTFD